MFRDFNLRTSDTESSNLYVQGTAEVLLFKDITTVIINKTDFTHMRWCLNYLVIKIYRNDNTWEPFSNLDCGERIAAYEASLVSKRQAAAAAAAAVATAAAAAGKLVVVCFIVS